MREDDEIIESYERDLADIPERTRSNRGFWLVAGTIVIAGVFLVVEIFANLSLKDTIAHAQSSLRTAESAARAIEERTGSLAGARPEAMHDEDPSLRYLTADEPSRGLDEVSVAAGEAGWAVAVRAKPGACFYLRLTPEDVFYGAGEVCSGTEALAAADARW